MLFVLMIIGGVLLWILGPVGKWRVLPIVLGVVVYVGLKQAGILADLVPSGRARKVILFLGSILPFWAYGHGALGAEKILSGAAYQFTTGSKLGGQGEGEAAAVYKYIGHAGDRAFFVSADNSSIVIHRPQGDLVLKYHPELERRR